MRLTTDDSKSVHEVITFLPAIVCIVWIHPARLFIPTVARRPPSWRASLCPSQVVEPSRLPYRLGLTTEAYS
ncbi:hypothetical protein MIC448_230015 [Microbacterium sp. C448]|nr:hypothetical protein MIC448_230015 [Microbacterium sp. C448]